MDNKNNSGDGNSGYSNFGDLNSGSWNFGNCNSGNYNSGYRNSGDGNSGHGNSGNWNSGVRNSGNFNSGHWNSGYGNSTDRESGIFNSEEPTIRMFNKPTNLKWDEIDHPHFREFYLTKWIPEENMTDEEKEANPEYDIRKGYLKTFDYKEAWANFWKDTDEENRRKFLALPNFDANVFKDITGIDVLDTSDVIEIEGKKYTISEIKKALGR
jgi:hypothetical protein